MKKHIVTCVQCGRQFDANFGGYYNNETRRYTCKKCGKKMVAAEKARAAGRSQNKGQSKGGMIIKIAAGALFIIAGFMSPDSGWSVGYFLTALVIGCALIAWGLLPHLQAKKQETAKIADQQAHAAAAENEPKKCPACGATTKGSVCEYCGTKL